MSEFINNREERQKTMKQLIRELHDGARVEDVKERFSKVIQNLTATEISQLEQALIDEGLPVEEIKRLCDVHTEVFLDSLEQQQVRQETIPGHPVYMFKKENRAIEELINTKIKPALEKLEQSGYDSSKLPDLRIALNQLGEIDKHYLRKENLLFPFLEKYGVTGPSSVMWGIHDDIRLKLKDTLKMASEAQSAEEVKKVVEAVNELNAMVDSMIFKEENIMLPMCLDLLTEDEWGQIRDQSSQIGFCLVEEEFMWQPGKSEPKAEKEKAYSYTPQGYLKFDTGILTLEEVNLIFNHLPVDITFVDKDDTVKYFSQGKERIFHRTQAVIGRKVQNCHPPASVHVVEKIINDFKAGKRDVAEFWIQMKDMFIYIRYFAVRNAQGEYVGTLEVSQNITGIKKLEGEKRLLD